MNIFCTTVIKFSLIGHSFYCFNLVFHIHFILDAFIITLQTSERMLNKITALKLSVWCLFKQWINAQWSWNGLVFPSTKPPSDRDKYQDNTSSIKAWIYNHMWNKCLTLCLIHIFHRALALLLVSSVTLENYLSSHNFNKINIIAV
jgi:hypothetical protein